MAQMDMRVTLQTAIGQGAEFTLNKEGKLETMGFWASIGRSIDNFFSSSKTEMKRNNDVMLAMSEMYGPSKIGDMSGPVKLSTLSQETQDIVVPYDKVTEAKNRIAEMYFRETCTTKDLIDIHNFSADDAKSIRTCMLDNIKTGFLRPMLAKCKDVTAIRKCIDKMVSGARTKHGAFLIGLDPNNSFPKIWQDIKDTMLCDMHNLKTDYILGRAFKEFEDWSNSGSGKSPSNQHMASWVNRCQALRSAAAVYPPEYGYAAYHGLVEDKMRLGYLFGVDPGALSFALSRLQSMRREQPKGELTLETICFCCFGKVPPEITGNEDDALLSTRLSQNFDKWLMLNLKEEDQTDENRGLMRRMIMEFRPEAVVEFVSKAVQPDRPKVFITHREMINADATFTHIPNQDEPPIKSMLRDIPLRSAIMRPDRYIPPHELIAMNLKEDTRTISPYAPLIHFGLRRCPVGDVANWGTQTVTGVFSRTTVFKKGPVYYGSRMKFSDDELRKYKEGGNSEYALSIIDDVKEVCRGNSSKQFDAVMRYLSNAPVERLFGYGGPFSATPTIIPFDGRSGVNMDVSRKRDGSVKIEITSDEPVGRNGWVLSLHLVVTPDGFLKDSRFELGRLPVPPLRSAPAST